MHWPFQKTAQRASRSGCDQIEPILPEPAVHRSPALRTLFRQFREGSSYRILDLGTAIGANIEFFARFSCRFHIADLIGSLRSDEALLKGVEERPEAVFERLLPPEAEPFDVVLAWDVFNYLGRDQLSALALRLARLCRPGAHLLAFVSASREIPEQPIVYRIRDQENLIHHVRTPGTRPCPRFAPAEIRQLLQGFSIDRVYQLRHGVQEYLTIRYAKPARRSGAAA